jgi:spore germination protein
MLCKLSLLLFALNRLFNTFRRKDSDFNLVPLALLLSLTIRLFKNNIDGIEYSFFTWPTKGLLLELIIVFLFLILKRGKSDKVKKMSKKYDGIN